MPTKIHTTSRDKNENFEPKSEENKNLFLGNEFSGKTNSFLGKIFRNEGLPLIQ